MQHSHLLFKCGIETTKKNTESITESQSRKNRAARNKARRMMKLKKGDGKEVDHKRPLSKGGSNSRKNLRVVSRKTNRRKGAK